LRTLELLLAGGLFYLIGSIPFSYLLVRLVAGVDLRTVGSGNVGATNVGRVLGRRYYFLALVLDLGKGLLAGGLARLWGLPLPLAALAVVGHNWSVFLRGRGGKGVATTMGLLAIASWEAWLVAVAIWAGLISWLRYASVASLGALFSAPVFVWVFEREQELQLTLLMAALALLSLWRHRENLARLRRGEEHRASL